MCLAGGFALCGEGVFRGYLERYNVLLRAKKPQNSGCKKASEDANICLSFCCFFLYILSNLFVAL